MILKDAHRLAAAGRIEDALALLRESPAWPTDARYPVAACRLLTSARQPADALSAVDGVPDALAHRAPLLLTKAEACLDAGAPGEALLLLKKAQTADPDNLVVRGYLALAHLARHEWGPAKAVLDAGPWPTSVLFRVRLCEWMETEWLRRAWFFESRPTTVPPHTGSAPWDRTLMNHFAAKRFEPFFAGVRCRLERKPGAPDLLLAAAMGAEMLRDYEYALQAMDELPPFTEETPDDYPAVRGRVLLRLRRFREAAVLLERVVMIGPMDYLLNYHLGVLCLAFGEQDHARRLFLRAFADYQVDTLDFCFYLARTALMEALGDPERYLVDVTGV